MKRLTILAACITAATAANAQLVVGHDGTDSMYVIDVGTGVATPLNTGGLTDAWGLAADNTNGILYWNNGVTLHSASFASILAGTASPTSVTMTFGGANQAMVGLGFNPANGMLLATKNIATEAVYEVDPITGIATQLYVYSTTFDFGGLDYDAASGGLFGLSDPATARGLYQIDYLGMTETLRAPYPAGETDIDGLAVNNGLAYYITDGPNTAQANLYVYDIGTGAQVGTIASPFVSSGIFSAGAWAPALVVPEPGSFVALGIGLAVLAALRRRK